MITTIKKCYYLKLKLEKQLKVDHQFSGRISTNHPAAVAKTKIGNHFTCHPLYPDHWLPNKINELVKQILLLNSAPDQQ